MDWAALGELVKVFGVPVALALAILYGGAKGWWVFGWVFRAMEEDRDWWRDDARGVTNVLEKVVPAARRRPRAPRAPRT